jgi:GTP-binding protein
MAIPQIVIVGRPNVGKSSLLNWLAGRRIAIVDPTAGVTRDRVTTLVEVYDKVMFQDRFIELIDTGGIGINDVDNLTDHIEDQIEQALESATVVLMVVDTRAGLTTLDEEVARRLRYVNVPVFVVANKTDTPAMDPLADEFYRLGRKVIRVSAEQFRGKEELIDTICEKLPPPVAGDEVLAPPDPVMKLTIVGRRNVGKSTFVNTLAQAERMIVSEVPGTTRDSVDVRFEMDGKPFIAIDTPGFRRRQSIDTNLDFYSTHRAQRSIRRADVVLLFFDAAERISKVDKQLVDYIAQQYKPCIFVVNKWDLYAGSVPMEKWVAYLRDTFRMMHYVPIAFITGKAGKNVKALLNHAMSLHKQSLSRVSTAQLNKLVQAAIERNPPPLSGTRQPKIYYGTQVAVQPPTVVLFCNDPKALSKPYQRYLLGLFRDQLEFGEVPVKLYLRQRESSDGEGAGARSSRGAEAEEED